MKVKIKKESVRFMYCPNCNQYNDDQNRFCAFCGTPLQKQQTEMPNTGSYQSQQPQSFGAPDEGSYQPQQSYQQPQQGYEQPQAPYQQTWQPPQSELTKPISMATPVVSLILNIVFFNPVGLILAVLSLLNFNNYTSEKNRGAMENAETYKRKAKTFAVVANVLAVLTFILLVAGIVAIVVFGVLRNGNGAVEFNYNGSDLPPEFFNMIP